jgi:hypothetical protein
MHVPLSQLPFPLQNCPLLKQGGSIGVVGGGSVVFAQSIPRNPTLQIQVSFLQTPFPLQKFPSLKQSGWVGGAVGISVG